MTGGLIVIFMGALVVLIGALLFLLLQRPAPRPTFVPRSRPSAPQWEVPDANVPSDTVVFEPIGPSDGDEVRIEGVVLLGGGPVGAPSGARCVFYELYGGEDGGRVELLRRGTTAFFVDDGVMPVRIDPSTDVISFDLPAVELASATDAAEVPLVIERRLMPGARVRIQGQVQRTGAPGFEELTLHPTRNARGITLTFLSERGDLPNYRPL